MIALSDRYKQSELASHFDLTSAMISHVAKYFKFDA